MASCGGHGCDTETAVPAQGRQYRDTFPSERISNDNWGSFGEYAVAAHVAGRTGNNDRRLRSIVEGTPSDGGFVVPTEYARQVFDVALESEIVRPRATVWPMASNTRKVPGVEIGDHSSNLFGGMVGYWSPVLQQSL